MQPIHLRSMYQLLVTHVPCPQQPNAVSYDVSALPLSICDTRVARQHWIDRISTMYPDTRVQLIARSGPLRRPHAALLLACLHDTLPREAAPPLAIDARNGAAVQAAILRSALLGDNWFSQTGNRASLTNYTWGIAAWGVER